MHNIILHNHSISLHLLCFKLEAERSIYAMCNKKVSYENMSFKSNLLLWQKDLQKDGKFEFSHYCYFKGLVKLFG